MKKLDEKISVNIDISLLLSSMKEEQQRLVSFVNPFSYRILLKSPNIIDNIDLFYSDGSLLQRFHNIFYSNSKVKRVSFDYSSIANNVFEYAQKHSIKITLIGGSAEEILKAQNNIMDRYPSIDIVFARSGFFFSEEEKQSCYREISKCETEIVIVGMGTPLQEKFIIEAKINCPQVKLMFTCGGFLTQTAIKPDYYHPLIKKSGLRWLQRVIMHQHVRERIIKDYPKFVFSYLYEHIAIKLSKKI